MNFEERLEQLAERHKALTQSIELQTLQAEEHNKQWEERFRLMLDIVEQTQRSIATTNQHMAEMYERTQQQFARTQKRIDLIGRLVEIHELRLDKLEAERHNAG